MTILVAGAATLGLAASAHAAAGPGGGTGGSRLDDGKDLLSQAKVTERQAITAAQPAASGALNEVDLEHRHGKLVWNVEVGKKDVKVDAGSGEVMSVDQDD